MSRCSVFFVKMPGVLSTLCTLLAIPWLTLALMAPVQAQANPTIRIETVEDFALGEEFELSVDLEGHDFCNKIGGFALAIAWDPGFINLNGVVPGQLLDDCDWEYFNYRIDTTSEYMGYPLGPYVRIVAVAGTSGNPPGSFSNSTELAVLQFTSTSRASATSAFAPVRFFWVTCGDNELVNPTGDTLFVSDGVYYLDSIDVTYDQPLPTYGGLPQSCMAPDTNGLTAMVRNIDFHNGGVIFSGDTTAIDSVGAVVSIERKRRVSLGSQTTLSVNLDNVSEGFTIGGFELLMEFDPLGLIFEGAEQGELLTNCEWDWFDYQHVYFDTPTGKSYIQFLAVADTYSSTGHPACFADTPGELVALHFRIPHDMNLLGQNLPINFIWHDCSSNTFTGETGDTLLLSRRVFDFNGFDVTAEDSFPTTTGAPESCSDFDPSIVRMIDFHSGGLSNLDLPPIDERGDLNLNGIAYEIADWVIFGNFFYTGPEVFTIDFDKQAAASDVNADGMVLTLRDFMYLYGVIVGLRLPYPANALGIDTDTVTFTQDSADGRLYAHFPDSLAAVLLTFDGEIIPEPLVDTDRFMWWHLFDGSQTRVMLSPKLIGMQTGDGHPGFYSGALLSYSGVGTLVNAEAADYDDTYFVILIDSANIDEPEMQIRIDTVRASPGGHARVDILLDYSNREMGGFDFLVEYDASILSLWTVDPGSDLFGGCDWQYFTYRQGPFDPCSTSCPSGLIRIVGLAEYNGPMHPACFLPDHMPSALAELTFEVTEDRTMNSDLAPVRFVWLDCGDNAVADKSGLDLYTARRVFDVHHGIVRADTIFPSYGGPIPACPGDFSPYPIFPAIDFYNGGVRILAVDSTRTLGDLNLNGVAFEIADALLYAMYFVFGPEVFPEPRDLVKLNSDINGDGETLTVTDFVLMIRIIVGDLYPPVDTEPSPNVATFHLDLTSGIISFDTPDTLGAVLLEFSGDVTPVLLQDHMDLQYDFDGAVTSVLISKLESGQCLSSGDLLSFTGEGELAVVETATFDGRTVTVQLDSPTGIDGLDGDGLPDTFSLSQNYPNPFNPLTKISFTLPTASRARLEIFNVLGQRVTTLVDSDLPAGQHTFSWDGSCCSSGIYLYRLVADEYEETRKMTLMK